MKLHKIAISLATFSLATGLYALPAFAAADSSNLDISGNSFADSESLDNDNVTVDSSNLETELDNIDVALGNTGLNFQNGNEDGNGLTASNASAEYETENFLNVNEASGNDGASATNTNITGDSDGDSLADDSDVVSVDNTNQETDVFNVTASVANSGINFQNHNEDGNDLTAGRAWSYAGTSNVVNHNEITGSCEAPVCGSARYTATAENSNVSGHSFADSEAFDNDKVTVANTNTDTNLVNVTASVSNSGVNFQNGNEDGNTMTTGNTAAAALANNYVNVNETALGGSNATASNTNITDHSDGDAVAKDNDVISVTNLNNETDVLNVSVAVANSGGNSQNHNEDGNTMTTGCAEAAGVTTNVVNANTVSW